MISQYRIPPPVNWQDFEFLTLKLWGEIWNVQHEIEFNSGSGSSQKGVDIYCIPKNENGYFGIQCKNKKLFCKYGKRNKLTKSTIDGEIEKAKNFTPKLKKLIIATSFSKDASLEEYVREKSLNHIKNGLFSIQICFWDYYSRKIQEYENVFNFHMKNQNFINPKSIFVSFENDETEEFFSPEFIKSNVLYRLQTEEEKLNESIALHDAFNEIQKGNRLGLLSRIYLFFYKFWGNNSNFGKILINGVDINSQDSIESRYPREKGESNITPINFHKLEKDKQEFSFKIKINNTGRSVIDDFKLSFRIEGAFEKVEVAPKRISEFKTYKANTWIRDNVGLFEPSKNFLIQKDYTISKKIILTPELAKETEIKIKWALLARDFSDEGDLIIKIRPKYIERQKIMYVLKREDCKSEVEFSHKMIEAYIQPNF